MLKFKIKEKLYETGKANPQAWMRKHCGFGQKKAFNMYHARQKQISLEDLSILCEKLNCSPNDLFYWEQTPRLRLPDNHPCLTQLVAPDSIGGWKNLLSKMTAAEAAEYYKELAKKFEKKDTV